MSEPPRLRCSVSPRASSSLPHLLSRNEYVETLAKRVIYSRAYTAFYVSVIVAGCVEVAWIFCCGVGQLPQSSLFAVIESYVTLGLLTEVGMRAALLRRHFCLQVANVVDSLVAATSVATSALMALGLETRAEFLIAEVLVTGRVCFRPLAPQ